MDRRSYLKSVLNIVETCHFSCAAVFDSRVERLAIEVCLLAGTHLSLLQKGAPTESFQRPWQ